MWFNKLLKEKSGSFLHLINSGKLQPPLDEPTTQKSKARRPTVDSFVAFAWVHWLGA